ncbi:MAG: signal peptidase II [Christensenellales bacterium]
MLETLIILVFTVVDQLVKLWAAGPLKNLHGGDLPLIEGVFHFTYVENRGAAFGMLQNARIFFIVLTICAIVALTVYLVKKRRSLGTFVRVALALIYAGAVGNLIDRAILGYVRDMFDFRLIRFYVFNVADACLTVGAAMIVLIVIADEFRQRKRAKDAAQESDGAAEPLTERSREDCPHCEGDSEGTTAGKIPSSAVETDRKDNQPIVNAAEGNHAD